MGNAGSAHNLQNDCIQSELNLCYTQQYLRRTTGENKKKSQVPLGGWSSGRNVTDCRVLPKPTEHLKLRATTNGAILQAGGTISFRAKEAAERKHETTSLHPMRRCHTLILDGQNDTLSQRKSVPPLTEFRRSQTLLHVGYNKRKSQDNIAKGFDYSLPQASQNTSSASTLKVIKYNKKRKAPPAPIKNLSKHDDTSPVQNHLLNDIKNPSLAKPRIYTTNTSKTQSTQKQFQSPTMKVTPFQRDSNVRTSVNSSRQIQPTNSTYSSKLPYRREKSFDAKLLRQKETNDFSDKRVSAPGRKDGCITSNISKLESDLVRNGHESNGMKKIARQHGNKATNKDKASFNNSDHSEANYLKDRPKVEECSEQQESTQLTFNKTTKHEPFTEYSNSANERKTKYPQSRIPQLKRTFYFGMESLNKTPDLPTTLPSSKTLAKNEKLQEESEDMIVLNHKIDADEEIIDNGILVHVRPTLPRRQLETPSFSPAAAWRNLLEEQQRLQRERTKPKQEFSNARTIETPICLKTSAKENFTCPKANWTPQQDLDDDDDEEGKEVKKPEKYSNPLHIFSLSLPRDVHLQCQAKSSTQYTEQENILKPASCWLVPGFNSLQKFKTQLGKPTDFRSIAKCTCTSNIAFKRNSYQLENTFADSIDSKCYHLPDCEFNKSTPKPTQYQNDNWLLHKSKSKDSPVRRNSKILDDNCLKSPSNSLSLINFEPKSLSNICSGKHIVYLPGQELLNSSTKTNYKNSKQNKTNKSNYKRQRQRQETVRESLQDLTPIQNIHQSNANITEKNTHRFSFQSTVRVLEKRRLAEKLSKDAEVQEAQRLNELEAMKRVEEDFQRKRAPEKANLRNQLRLHFKANAESAEYRSLPLNINEKFDSQQTHNQMISDANNNIFCRAEPDGAVSPSAELNDGFHQISHTNFAHPAMKVSKELDCFEYDGEESESETQLPDLQCTALLIEPYLNSII